MKPTNQEVIDTIQNVILGDFVKPDYVKGEWEIVVTQSSGGLYNGRRLVLLTTFDPVEGQEGEFNSPEVIDEIIEELSEVLEGDTLDTLRIWGGKGISEVYKILCDNDVEEVSVGGVIEGSGGKLIIYV